MTLDRGLLELLACPSEDHAPLTPAAGDPALVCTVCGTSYPVRDGIPVLLVDDATPGPNGIGVPAGTGVSSEPADPPDAGSDDAPEQA